MAPVLSMRTDRNATRFAAPWRIFSLGNLSNQEISGGESYDLSAFFTFKDDPDAEDALTATTVSMSRPTTAQTPLHYQPDQGVQFEFDPDVSFDLGISPSFDQGANVMNNVCHQDAEKHARGKKRRRKKIWMNPHNDYLAKHYDAERIKQGLMRIGNIAGHDRKVSRGERHLYDQFEQNETQLPSELAVDEGSEVAGFSLQSTVLIDSPPMLKNGRHRVKFFETDSKNKHNVATDYDLKQSTCKSTDGKNISFEKVVKRTVITSLDVQDSKEKVFTNHGEASELSLHKDHNNDENQVNIEQDDEFSTNNPLAVERFISAPRLCQGTKDIPSIIRIESDYEDDSHYTPLAQKQSQPKFIHTTTTSPSSQSSIFRPKTVSSLNSGHYTAPYNPSISTEKSMQRNSRNEWKRVKEHMAQLPFVMYTASDSSVEGLFTGSSQTVGSQRSFGSPKGIADFDERRPWRKRGNMSGTQNRHISSKEKEVIWHLKSQIKMLMSQFRTNEVHSTSSDTVGNKSHDPNREYSKMSSIRKLKSHLRSIEASYSSEDTRRQGVRNNSESSLEQLKVQRRQMESTFGKSRTSSIRKLKSHLRSIEASYSSEDRQGVRSNSESSLEQLKVQRRKIESTFGKGISIVPGSAIETKI